MGPYQRTPKEVARAIRYSGLGVRSVGPVGDFLDVFCSDTLPFGYPTFVSSHKKKARWAQRHRKLMKKTSRKVPRHGRTCGIQPEKSHKNTLITVATSPFPGSIWDLVVS